jgi:starch synthase (maltosyl-transferring)
VLRYPDKRFATESDREYQHRCRSGDARFSAWYEFFPRSTAQEPGKHGTFADCEKRLPYVAEMGFNVVYLPPIHPIGVNFRKGRNNNPESASRAIKAARGRLARRRAGIKHPSLSLGRSKTSAIRPEGQGAWSVVALDIAFQARPIIPM